MPAPDTFDDLGCTWKVVAHRGHCGALPENAMESLDRLPSSVDGVEVDVRLCGDRVPVLLHDATVDRTTGGTGEIARMPLETIRKLAGAEGTRVPTLAGYLAACAGHDLDPILVDVKTPAPAALAEAVKVVHRSPLVERCIMMVRSAKAMAEVRRHSASIRLGVFGATTENATRRIAAARRHGAELVLVAHGDERYLRNRRVVAMVQAAGLRAGASVINATAALEAARADGCDVVLTDAADRIVRSARLTGGAISAAARRSREPTDPSGSNDPNRPSSR